MKNFSSNRSFKFHCRVNCISWEIKIVSIWPGRAAKLLPDVTSFLDPSVVWYWQFISGNFWYNNILRLSSVNFPGEFLCILNASYKEAVRDSLFYPWFITQCPIYFIRRNATFNIFHIFPSIYCLRVLFRFFNVVILFLCS